MLCSPVKLVSLVDQFLFGIGPPLGPPLGAPVWAPFYFLNFCAMSWFRHRFKVQWDTHEVHATTPHVYANTGKVAQVFAVISIPQQQPYFGSHGLSHPMNSNYSNVAQLKDLMTAPPMTAAQHAEVMRKRIAHRRMVEEARDLKRLSGQSFDQR